MSELNNPLNNRVINLINLAKDKKAIKFTLDGNEEVIAKCDGDCCSNTWIENVELPAAGFPAKVLSVEELDLPGCPYGEEGVSHYGLKIITDRGEIVLDYRNESNGYYGGNLSWPGEYHYGGVFEQNNSTLEWE